jgi:hypothetical protein
MLNNIEGLYSGDLYLGGAYIWGGARLYLEVHGIVLAGNNIQIKSWVTM